METFKTYSMKNVARNFGQYAGSGKSYKYLCFNYWTGFSGKENLR